MENIKTKYNDNDFNNNCIRIVSDGKYLIGSNKNGSCSIFIYAYNQQGTLTW